MDLNPGHLDALRKLGILNPDEAVVDPQVLAERVIHSPYITETISIIRQEALNTAMSLDVVSQTIDEIADILPDLNTRDAIWAELAGLQEEIEPLPRLAQHLLETRIFMNTLFELSKQQGITVPTETRQHLQALDDLIRQLPDDVLAQTQQQLLKGQRVIVQLVEKLTTLD